MHFLADLWGYWEKNPHYARYINYSVGLLVALTIIAGFFIVGTPQEARLMRMDAQKVQDLQTIQWQIVNYWQQKQSLPPTLEELEDPISGFSAPVDRQTGESYTYRTTGPRSFELCAVFNMETKSTNFIHTERMIPMPAEPGYTVDENWSHAVGEVCFDRTIDPDRYPPYTKPTL